MEKIAFVKLQYDHAAHWIPATEIKQETGALAIYNGARVVGRFDLVRVEHWALELAPHAAEVPTMDELREKPIMEVTG